MVNKRPLLLFVFSVILLIIGGLSWWIYKQNRAIESLSTRQMAVDNYLTGRETLIREAVKDSGRRAGGGGDLYERIHSMNLQDPATVPVLVKMIGEGDSDSAMRTLDFALEIQPGMNWSLPLLQAAVQHSSETVRLKAVETASQQYTGGVEAPREAEAVFLSALDDQSGAVRAQAAMGLEYFPSISETAMRALIAHSRDEGLESPRGETVGGYATQAISKHSGSFPGLTTEFREYLKDPDPMTRIAGLKILDNAASESEEISDEIIELLQDQNPGVAAQAAFSLTRPCPHLKKAVPELRAIAQGKDLLLRQAALGALASIELDESTYISGLIDLADDARYSNRGGALATLSKAMFLIGPNAGKYANRLLLLIGRHNSSFDHQLGQILSNVGPEALKLLPALEAIVASKDASTARRSGALKCIERIKQSEKAREKMKPLRSSDGLKSSASELLSLMNDESRSLHDRCAAQREYKRRVR